MQVYKCSKYNKYYIHIFTLELIFIFVTHFTKLFTSLETIEHKTCICREFLLGKYYVVNVFIFSQYQLNNNNG